MCELAKMLALTVISYRCGRSCHGLGAFPDYSWMPRGNAKESERRPFGASPVLLPVAKRMNADTDRRSESDL